MRTVVGGLLVAAARIALALRATVVLLWLFLSCLPSLPCSASVPQEIKPNPINQYEPHGYINDFAGMIDSKAQSKLDPICKDLDKKKRTQLVFVTVMSLEGLSGKEFATQLANRWGVGHKDTNRGILVLLSRNDRQFRISVGLGLESVLTDEEADRLGQEMLPMLRKEEYGNALLHLPQQIHDEIQRLGKMNASQVHQIAEKSNDCGTGWLGRPQWSGQKRPCVVTSKPAIWNGPGRSPYLSCFLLIRQVCFGSPASRSAF
jgi:uncharacterized membrane protein YgcG